MAQPFRAKDQEGISTWSLEDLKRHQQKMDEERMKELEAQREKEFAPAVEKPEDQGRESDYEMDEEEEREMMALDGGN